MIRHWISTSSSLITFHRTLYELYKVLWRCKYFDSNLKREHRRQKVAKQKSVFKVVQIFLDLTSQEQLQKKMLPCPRTRHGMRKMLCWASQTEKKGQCATLGFGYCYPTPQKHTTKPWLKQKRNLTTGLPVSLGLNNQNSEQPMNGPPASGSRQKRRMPRLPSLKV